MFKDKEEALRRLETELLREDEEQEEELTEDWEDESEAWDEEPEDWEDESEVWDEESEDWEEEAPEDWGAEADRRPEFQAYNSDHLDQDLESFSREVYDTERRVRGRWAAAAAMVVLAGLLLALAFLAARYMGR